MSEAKELVRYFFKPIDISKAEYRKVNDFEKWDPKKVFEWMEECVEQKGFPEFRVRYRDDYGVFYRGKPAVYAICWGRFDRVPTVVFYDVPDETWLEMASRKGDWEFLLEKWKEEKVIDPVKISRLEQLIRRRHFRYYVLRP